MNKRGAYLQKKNHLDSGDSRWQRSQWTAYKRYRTRKGCSSEPPRTPPNPPPGGLRACMYCKLCIGLSLWRIVSFFISCCYYVRALLCPTRVQVGYNLVPEALGSEYHNNYIPAASAGFATCKHSMTGGLTVRNYMCTVIVLPNYLTTV